jgi:hypothetical protein
MHRREFVKCGISLAPTISATPGWGQVEQPEIAFTFDDPETDDCGGLPWQKINTRMLAHCPGTTSKPFYS